MARIVYQKIYWNTGEKNNKQYLRGWYPIEYGSEVVLTEGK